MKTLVVGPAPSMKGGITTVIATHARSPVWERWGCVWIGSAITSGPLLKILYSLWGFLRFLVNLPGTKLVHIHLTFRSSAWRKRPFFEVARLLKIPVILHLHAPSYDESQAGYLFPSVSSMFRRATLVVALSKSWETNIRRHVPEARTAVLPNAVDMPDSVPAMEDRKSSIFYAGKLEARKGYTYLVEAFALVAKDLPGWTLEFAGNGEIEEAKAMASRLGLADRILVHGWTERGRMRTMLGNAKLFCLPSFAEGFPMSVLEAFASGCAVLTTPVGGLPDELVDGEDLLFFPPGDAQALADRIKRLATSPDLTRALSLRGRELSRSRFSCEASIELLEALYRKAVS